MHIIIIISYCCIRFAREDRVSSNEILIEMGFVPMGRGKNNSI
jgi:hypothetical protein